MEQVGTWPLNYSTMSGYKSLLAKHKAMMAKNSRTWSSHHSPSLTYQRLSPTQMRSSPKKVAAPTATPHISAHLANIQNTLTWSIQPKYPVGVKPSNFFLVHRMDSAPSWLRFTSTRVSWLCHVSSNLMPYDHTGLTLVHLCPQRRRPPRHRPPLLPLDLTW